MDQPCVSHRVICAGVKTNPKPEHQLCRSDQCVGEAAPVRLKPQEGIPGQHRCVEHQGCDAARDARPFHEHLDHGTSHRDADEHDPLSAARDRPLNGSLEVAPFSVAEMEEMVGLGGEPTSLR